MPINTGKASPLRELTFLIIDDHDFMRRIINEALVSSGVGKVERASDGLEALKILNNINSRFDFIVTDFNMPRMSGLELLREIRIGNAGVKRDIPVIMLSGFDDETLLVAAVNLDANGFIPKPVSRGDLIDRLERVVMGEFEVREADYYRSVKVPEIDDAFYDAVQGEKARRSTDSQDRSETQASKVTVSLDDVQPGSILAENLHTKNGTLLIEAGVTIRAGLIEMLKDTKKTTGVEKIAVKIS